MKKVVAFLLVLFIFVTPITTFVKADVVIGDNDETMINENATILGRKLALLESFSDLALSGVTDFTISNTNDVDSYLDYLWGEIGDAIDSLSDGTGFTEIANNLKSKYFTNLVQYKDYIINRGTYLAHMLPSGNPTTTLLSTFFANNIYGKQYTEHYDLALDMFRSLSALTRDDPDPEINPDYLTYIRTINSIQPYGNLCINLPSYFTTGGGTRMDKNINDFRSISYFNYFNGIFNNFTFSNNGLTINNISGSTEVLNCYINNDGTDNYICTISGITKTTLYKNMNVPNDSYFYYKDVGATFNSETFLGSVTSWHNNYSNLNNYTYTTSGTLSQVFSNLANKFRNINIYVDGVPWSIVSDNTQQNPNLYIDGIIKIYGNDTPQQYELQPNTKIDYDQLYQVIYNAIRDNLPINQGDIDYYDSHDTIYSPTIINNYGEEDGDESDLIDTILDYAVIPKFDTAIAQPMRTALTNGVVIMNTSITNVIPNEILLILGACFFLLLFAVVINRMIK